MKNFNVRNDCETLSITVSEGELIKITHGRKSVIVNFIRSGDLHCFECCFNTDGSGLRKLGLNGCTTIPVSCVGGHFKTLDHILEDL